MHTDILVTTFPVLCVCACVCLWSTHLYCSAPLSIPGHTHISHPYTFRFCCTVDGRLSGYTQFLSSLLHIDRPHHNRHHGHHSLLHKPLVKKTRKILKHMQKNSSMFSACVDFWSINTIDWVGDTSHSNWGHYGL